MEHILRSEDIELAGPLTLNPALIAVSHTLASPDNDQARQVRVAEEHPDYAVVEVVCSCGKKIQIRCNY